jgi:outer membrane protein assembly factor BamA
VKVQYYEPHFLQTRFFLNSSVSWSFNVERYFNSERFEAQSNLGYYISDLYLIKLGYNFYKTALSNVSVDLLPGEEDNFSNQLIAELTYDTRDSKIYSRKGMFIRINGSISEPFSLEGMDFAKLELSIRKFIPVKNLAVWALQAKSGNIFTLQANYIPLEERFFLGGVTTVRGYPRNSLGPETTSGIPVGGNYYYLLRSGLRFHIWNWVGGKILMDNGGLYNNISSAMWRDNYTGTGLGIQIGWGIWGAQLEYTWKIEETVKPGMWYFEIGQTF